MGDLVLRKTAQRLSRSGLTLHTIARLGGDELVLVLENITVAEAIDTVGRLSRLIATPQGFAHLIEDLIHGRELPDTQRRVGSRTGSTEPVV